MQLAKEDADLFFKLMWALQLYVNKKQMLFPEIETVDDLHNLDTSEKLLVREALYEDLSIIDDFVTINPAFFTTDELALVTSWKKAIHGTFYIERLLKKHAIFMQEDNQQVFAVHALYDPFSDMFYARPLPTRVNAVLLPFKGVIIYDGLLQSYNLYFGSGIHKRLKEDYMRAKQNNRIITTLDKKVTTTEQKTSQKTIKTYTKEVKQLDKIAKKLRGGVNQPPIESPVFSLVKASIGLADIATQKNHDRKALWKEYEKVRRALNKAHTIISRIE